MKCPQITFCGTIFSKEDMKSNPEYIQGITEMVPSQMYNNYSHF